MYMLSALTVNERKSLHVASVGRLTELDPFLFEPLAGLVHIGDGDADVSESSRVFVAGVVFHLTIILSAPVVG